MKTYKLFIIILVVFLKTGNVLSDNKIFNVNNIEIEKRGKASYEALANQAIKKGFNLLIEKILLTEDSKKLIGLKFSQIKELVKYYQVSDKVGKKDVKKTVYNISFDKNKIHSLFYKRSISYSDIGDKELFILPILKNNDQFFIYNQNYFYNNWNQYYNNELIEFILPLENIEIIQNVNLNKKNLLNLDLNNLFEEYSKKNLALVLIEIKNRNEEKIYLKIKILGKEIVRNINIKRLNLNKEMLNIKIITEVKKEIINIVKSHNLIDIRTPSFLNAQLNINKKSNLVELNSRLKKIDLIEKIYVQEFNSKFIIVKIRYLGKLDKIIKQLEDQKIILKLTNDQWSIRII
tara:strand:- start:259 stop:1302 length:1044 start_codon:yes stop_codon:yes gene_type:complete